MTNATIRAADFVLKAAFITSALLLYFLISANAASAAEAQVVSDVYVPVAASADPAPAETASEPAAPTEQERQVEVVAMSTPIPDEDEVAAMLPSNAANPSPANVAQGEERCLATAIYFEARGESEKGQKAVAEVILARTRTPGRPSTVCGVVYEGAERSSGCQFSFTCDRAPNVAPLNEAWLRAQRIASEMLSALDRLSSIVRGATYYHAKYVSPPWAARMEKVATIGSHVFYRPRRGRYS